LRHASCLVRQGVWTKWENVIPFDLSWQNLIYGPGPRVISFLLNAQINSVRTPDMLKLWGYLESAACTLCGAPQCTLHHLLVNCEFARTQGRYTWRHDSVLMHIEQVLRDTILRVNDQKPVVFAEVARKEFHANFVKAGQKLKTPTPRIRRGLLDYANDWQMLVDFEHRRIVFPPCIVPTNLRPDVVLWSMRSHVVILLELTCPAEEGISAAQIRKESKYDGLLETINETKTWKARLFTLEVGARGLVASRTYRAFRVLGLSNTQTKSLVKCLSEIVVRCSYAIYLAHSAPVWSHNNDFVFSNSRKADAEKTRTPNIVTLRKQGIKYLYHFTDSANLSSIQKSGLMCASQLLSTAMPAVLNSDESSRQLDRKAGLENFVRLSFSKRNPMMFVSKKEGRISNPVILRIKLEAVSRPGVMFSNCNATRHDATVSEDPEIVRFGIVKKENCFAVPELLRHFYQAEVLVPSPLPAHLIIFPVTRGKTENHRNKEKQRVI
jgi:ssDNA thymidine ADP-ribosyltransferase, DarT/zinc-binding in reverse transcriptase